jgi:hypothetical protein
MSVTTAQQTSIDLTVITDEGDRVVLSARSSTETSQIDYRHLARRSGQQVQVTVEGDLNERELADIQKLLKRLTHAARQAARGRIDKAVHTAQRIRNLGSLESFGFSLERAEQVTVARSN